MADNNSNDKLVRIKHRVDTLENWENNNPILANGEIGIITDIDYINENLYDDINYRMIALGDGSTDFNSAMKYLLSDIRFSIDGDYIIYLGVAQSLSFSPTGNKVTDYTNNEVNEQKITLSIKYAGEYKFDLFKNYCSNLNLSIEEIFHDTSGAKFYSFDIIHIDSFDVKTQFHNTDNIFQIITIVGTGWVNSDLENDGARGAINISGHEIDLYVKNNLILCDNEIKYACINDLSCDSEYQPLSAKQGKILNDKISQLESDIHPIIFKSKFRGLNNNDGIVKDDVVFSEYNYIELHIPGYCPLFLTKTNPTDTLYSLTDANQSVSGNYYGTFTVSGTSLVYKTGSLPQTAFPQLPEGEYYTMTVICHM